MQPYWLGGHDPRDYSEYLLVLARSVEQAGTRIDALGMAMPGAFLPHRIRRMMTCSPAPRISHRRMAFTAALCAVAAAILAAGTLVRAQSGATFEVVSVDPGLPTREVAAETAEVEGVSAGEGGLPPQVDHGRFSYTRALFGFIVRAYGLQGCGQNCAQLSRPGGLAQERQI